MKISVVLLIASLVTMTTAHSNGDDDSNPFLDMASAFLQESLANSNGGNGGGLAGIASLVGSFMQPDGKANGGGGGGAGLGGAAQILSGLGSLMGGANGNGGAGFDPSIIGNVIEMFTASQQQQQQQQPPAARGSSGGHQRQKRSQVTSNQVDDQPQEGLGLDTILNVVSMFVNANQAGSRPAAAGGAAKEEGLMSLLPMVLQAVNSFSGADGEKTHAKHKEHAWMLPPFLEKVHVMWDHFSSSELADALWKKSGVHSIFKGFTGRDGKLDYDRLFTSLYNQSFRRRWLKAVTLYMSDWASFVADPEVYQRYIGTGQMMLNGLLQSQGVPPKALFDPSRPSESISNLVDHVARAHLNTKVSSITYVKPAVSYVKDLFKLGKARGLLQKFNATELSDKLTDTVNLELIEPVLKVHRAYRFALQTPHCDKYVLCELNSHDPNEQLGLAGIKPGITKVGSMAAAWVISAETGTPFWTLFGVINEPYDCENRFPVDCTDFHEGEAKVTTEYAHNEL